MADILTGTAGLDIGTGAHIIGADQPGATVGGLVTELSFGSAKAVFGGLAADEYEGGQCDDGNAQLRADCRRVAGKRGWIHADISSHRGHKVSI